MMYTSRVKQVLKFSLGLALVIHTCFLPGALTAAVLKPHEPAIAPQAGISLQGGGLFCSFAIGELKIGGYTGAVTRWERRAMYQSPYSYPGGADYAANWETIPDRGLSHSYSLTGPVAYEYRALLGSGDYTPVEVIVVYEQASVDPVSGTNVIITTPVNQSQVFTADQEITISTSTAAETSVSLQAGDAITFEPGFETGTDAVFVAELDGPVSNPALFSGYQLAGGTISGANSYCGDATGTLSLQNHNGPVAYWQQSIDNGQNWSIIPNSSGLTQYTYKSLQQTTRYRAAIACGGCSPQYASTATISVQPAAGPGLLPPLTTYCTTGGEVTITLQGYEGAITRWERRERQVSPGGNSYTEWTTITGDANPNDNQVNLSIPGTIKQQVRAYVDGTGCSPFSGYSNITETQQSDIFPLGVITDQREVMAGDNEGLITYPADNFNSIIRWEKSTDGQNWQNIGQEGSKSIAYAGLDQATSYRLLINNGPGCTNHFAGTYNVQLISPWNSIETKGYAINEQGDSSLISHSLAWFDYHGQTLQSQSWDIASGKIFASEPLHDAFNREVGSTMSAPTRYQDFIYDPYFVQSEDGDAYDYHDFDRYEVGGSITDKRYRPAPLASDEPGTLGWYYSDNNTDEPYVATTQYPYSRAVYDDRGMGAPLKSAGPGDQHYMGSGHEALGYTFPVTDELARYIQVGKDAGIFPAGLTTLEGEAMQSLSGDVNGRYGISISDRGERVLIAAGQGDEYPLYINHTLQPGEEFYFYLLQASAITWSGAGSVSLENVETEEVRQTKPASLTAGLYKVTAAGSPVSISFTNWLQYPAYNYYDKRGQLVLSLSPNAVRDLEQGATFASVPKTTYTYDFQGRLLSAEEPDAGKGDSYYRKDGSIRFSINALQRGQNKASYTNYDHLGRPVESGELQVLNHSYTGGHAQFVSILEGILDNTDADGGINNSTFSVGGSATVQRVDWLKTVYDEPVPNTLNWTQTYIRGGVSYTENEESETWYSYDELGRTTWTMHRIKALPKLVTVNYQYDYLGNVIQVAYQQANVAEKFYHHYAYDAASRLLTVHTSTDGDPNGATARKQAQYYYYLHGPLKRVEIADQLQGVDYVYTIQGWLKSMNHPDHARDPGGDGSNGFPQDVFGMTLEYFSGDYTRSGTDIASLSVPHHAAYYDGNIRAMSWYAARPASAEGFGDRRMYAYRYDNKYQLTEATWGSPNFNKQVFTAAGNPYKVTDLDFDPNGNILNLRRYDGQGNDLHNFTQSGAASGYVYVPGKNQLASVAGHASYSYDALGQLTEETPFGESPDKHKRVSYDVTGKVTNVKDGHDTDKVSYTYDDRGFRLLKHNHETGLKTWYIRDASGKILSTYEQEAGGSVNQTEIPIYAGSRIGQYYKAQNTHLYELADHLGNVRVTFTDATLNYSTGFEPDQFTYDEQLQGFRNIDETSQTDHIISRTGIASSWLNPAYGRTQGASKTLKVRTGDVIDAQVFAKYLEDVPNTINTAEALATWLASMSSGGAGEGGTTGGSGGSTTGGIGAGDPLLLPDLYLNYTLYDQGMNVVKVGFMPMTTAAEGLDAQYEVLNLQITATVDGYVEVWIDNPSSVDINTWTDDFSLVHTNAVAIIQTSDYYPFGMVIPDRDWKNPAYNYRFGYQGQYAEKDEETGWSAFELRMYDATIARWTSVDPYRQYQSSYLSMGNNHMNRKDPDGGLDDYVFNKKTGDITLHKRTNDSFDRIGKLSNNGKYRVLIRDIAKGILSNGINLMKFDEVIHLGGKHNLSLSGVEDFLTRFSNSVIHKEISGIYLSKLKSASAPITAVYIDEYKGNDIQSASIDPLLLYTDKSLKGFHTIVHFHTHLSNKGFNRKDVENPSGLHDGTGDIGFKNGQKANFFDFIILTRTNSHPSQVQKILYTKIK